MKSKSNIPFLLIVCLLILSTVPALAGDLNGNLTGEVDVNIHVDKYAQIDNDDIMKNDWIPYPDDPSYDGEDGFANYLENLDSNEQLAPTTGGSSFTGKGGEEKWAATQMGISANTSFKIYAEAEYPTNADAEQLNANEVFYCYFFDKTNGPGAGFGPEDGKIYLKSISYPDQNPEQEFILASKVSMPNDFWTVKAGNYTGAVTFTVEAN